MNGAAADPRRLILWTVGAIVGAVLLLGFLYRARGALLLIYVSALLAMGMAPLARAIERIRFRGRPLPRWLAVAIIYVVVLAALVGLGSAVVPTFAQQAREFAAVAPEWFDQAQAKLIDWGVLPEPMTLREAIEVGVDAVTVIVALLLGSALLGVTGALLAVPTAAILKVVLLEVGRETPAERPGRRAA